VYLTQFYKETIVYIFHGLNPPGVINNSSTLCLSLTEGYISIYAVTAQFLLNLTEGVTPQQKLREDIKVAREMSRYKHFTT
jgi:hypothetical protein